MPIILLIVKKKKNSRLFYTSQMRYDNFGWRYESSHLFWCLVREVQGRCRSTRAEFYNWIPFKKIVLVQQYNVNEQKNLMIMLRESLSQMKGPSIICWSIPIHLTTNSKRGTDATSVGSVAVPCKILFTAFPSYWTMCIAPLPLGLWEVCQRPEKTYFS